MERALTPSRPDLVELFLSSTGRMSRLPFLAGAVCLSLLASAFGYLLTLGVDPRWGWGFYTLLLFPTACILSKRLHDRGRAGWWGFLIVWALIEAWPWPTSPLGAVALVVLAAAFVDLGLMPGQPRANRFGPSPAEARRV